MSNDSGNKNVFSLDLKVSIESAVLTESGRAFQIDGPATVNESSPNLVFVLETDMRFRVAERRAKWVPRDDKSIWSGDVWWHETMLCFVSNERTLKRNPLGGMEPVQPVSQDVSHMVEAATFID